MDIFDVIEKSEDFKSLKKEMQEGRVAKAILLISKDNFYLENFSKMLSMLILDGKACRKCENCQKVIASAHPDVKNYPSKDRLMVADSEEVVLESFVKPVLSDKKIFVIRGIDNALDGAQNKLLKTLEEPSKNVYLILTCQNIEKVLPTIRSRCSKVSLAKVNEQDAMALLQGDRQKAELAYAVSDGLIGKASELFVDRQFEDMCDTALSLVCEMEKSSQVLNFAKKVFAFKDKAMTIVEIFMLMIEDLIKIKSGQKELVKLKNFEKELEGVSHNYSIRALCEIAVLADKMMKEKYYNVSVTTILENFLLNVLEVKYICR